MNSNAETNKDEDQPGEGSVPDDDSGNSGLAENPLANRPWRPNVLAEILHRAKLRRERNIFSEHDEELIKAIDQIREEIRDKTVDDLLEEGRH